jgi:hypothetical protein
VLGVAFFIAIRRGGATKFRKQKNDTRWFLVEPGAAVANSGYKSATALTTAAGVPVVGQSELLRNGCQPGAICRCLAGLGLSPKLPSWFEE